MKLGLIGHPVAHSLSPRLQAFFLQQLGLAGAYDAWDTPVEELSDRLQHLWQSGVLGVNITVPYKEQVVALAHALSSQVQSVGSANTLVRTELGWHAYNTDISGFQASVPTSLQQRINGNTVWLLGAGGSAKAVLHALSVFSPHRIVIFSRSASKAKPLLDWLSVHHPHVVGQWHPWGQTFLNAGPLNLEPPVLVVNATSIGLRETDAPSDFDWLWPEMPAHSVSAMDLMYRVEQPTAFVAAATQAQCLWVQDGLPMLVHQGADALSLWTGQAVTPHCRQQALEHLVNP